MTLTEVAKAIMEIKALEAKEKIFAQRKEYLKDCLKAEMVSRGVDELAAGQERVTWKGYVSHTFDTKAFKAEYPELHAEFSKEFLARRFLVK